MEKCPVEKERFYYFNNCMRKLKVFLTILLLYEFTILTVLQIPRYCVGFFTPHFCNISFRYFFMVIVLPALITLFVWWMPEISRLFCRKCQCEVPHEKSIKDNVKEIVSDQDIERLISAIIVAGMQKFVSKHPKTTETLSDIIKAFIKSSDKKRLTK